MLKRYFIGGIMKNIKATLLVVFFMVLATTAVGIATEASFSKKNIENDTQSMLFDAEVTFYILTGEGCGCDPIPDVSIQAFGGEGSVSGVTDEDGMCVLTLVILGEYEVLIEKDEYHIIDFEFNVLDDQTFTFHLEKKDISSENTLLIFHKFIRNILER